MQVKGYGLNLTAENVCLVADLHESHTNILKYCARPFTTIQEMNEAIVKNWNACVKNPEDIVFLLGDISLPDRKLYPTEADQIRATVEFIKSLNGRIIAVFGSHDKHAFACKHLFTYCHYKNTIAEWWIDGRCIVMSHVPLLSWEKRAHGSLCAFGHVHTSPMHPVPCSIGSYDVGVDGNNFTPVPFADFVKKAESPEGKLPFNVYDKVEEKA